MGQLWFNNKEEYRWTFYQKTKEWVDLLRRVHEKKLVIFRVNRGDKWLCFHTVAFENIGFQAFLRAFFYFGECGLTFAIFDLNQNGIGTLFINISNRLSLHGRLVSQGSKVETVESM